MAGEILPTLDLCGGATLLMGYAGRMDWMVSLSFMSALLRTEYQDRNTDRIACQNFRSGIKKPRGARTLNEVVIATGIEPRQQQKFDST